MNPEPDFRVPDHADGPLQNAPLPNLNLTVDIQRQGIVAITNACNYYYFFVIQFFHAMLNFLVPAIPPGQHISNSHFTQLDHGRGLILNVVGDVISLSPFSSGAQSIVAVSHSNNYVPSSHPPLAGSHPPLATQPLAGSHLPSATQWPLASSHLTPAVQPFASSHLPSDVQPLASSHLTPAVQPFASSHLPSNIHPLANSHLTPAVQPFAGSHLPSDIQPLASSHVALANQVLDPLLTWENPVSHIQKYVFIISSASFISNHCIRSHNEKILAQTPHDLNELNDVFSIDDNNEDDDDDMNQENNDDFEDSGGEVDDPAPGSFMNQSGLSFPRDMNITDAYNAHYSGDEFNFPDDIYDDETQQPLAGPSRVEALGDQMIGM